MNSGIYQFRNIINNTIYIGSAKNLRYRKNRHLRELRGNKHHSLKFQRSFNKYGESNFEYTILEYVKEEYLIEREQFFLNEILFANINDNKFDYIALNIGREAKNTLGTTRTEESKQKMSIKAKERFKREEPWNKGKINVYTKEALLLMSLSKKGKKLNPEHASKVILNLKPIIGPLSEETKSKISISRKGKGVVSVIQFDMNNNFVEEYESILSAELSTGINRASISATCRGIQKKAGGYIWKYKS
jgi:group I intron endonuclease